MELPTALVVGGATAADAVAPAALDPAALPAPPSALGERFAAARRDPGYQGALSARVEARATSDVGQLLMAGAFMVFGLLFVSTWMAHAPGEMQAFGAVFFLIWFGTTGTVAWRAWSAMSAPQVTHLACVRARDSVLRHHHGHHGHHGSRTTVTQRVTLELEDGRRLALTGEDAVIGTLVEDDVGVAYVKGERLVGFRRLQG